MQSSLISGLTTLNSMMASALKVCHYLFDDTLLDIVAMRCFGIQGCFELLDNTLLLPANA